MIRLVAVAAGVLLAAVAIPVQARIFSDARAGFQVDAPSDWMLAVETQGDTRTVTLTSPDKRLDMGFVRVPVPPGGGVTELRQRYEHRLLKDLAIAAQRQGTLGNLPAWVVVYRQPAAGPASDALQIEVRYVALGHVGFAAWTAIGSADALALEPLASTVMNSFRLLPSPEGAADPEQTPAPAPQEAASELPPPPAVPLPRLGAARAQPPERCIDEPHRTLPAAARAALPDTVDLTEAGLRLHVPHGWKVIQRHGSVTVRSGEAVFRVQVIPGDAAGDRPIEAGVGRLKAEIALLRGAERRTVSAVAPCTEPAFALGGERLDAARFVTRSQVAGTAHVAEAFVVAQPAGGPVYAITIGGTADAFASAETRLKLMVQAIRPMPVAQISPSALNSAASASGSSSATPPAPTSVGASASSR